MAESRERVQAALHASGLSMPTKRVTVNLAPADLPKEGSHYDLPIAVGLMAAIGAIPADAIQSYLVLGELSLDGSITPVAGVLQSVRTGMRKDLSALMLAGQRQRGRVPISIFWLRAVSSPLPTIFAARRF